MLSAGQRQALVVMSMLLIAVVVAYPHLRGVIREYPVVVIALLGALALHAMVRGRVR